MDVGRTLTPLMQAIGLLSEGRRIEILTDSGVETFFIPQRAPSSPHLARELNRYFFPQFCTWLAVVCAVGWIEIFGGAKTLRIPAKVG